MFSELVSLMLKEGVPRSQHSVPLSVEEGGCSGREWAVDIRQPEFKLLLCYFLAS